MKRIYKSGENTNILFFVGKEVEHTPAHGHDTLFIVGLQSINDIQLILDENDTTITHIFFGANQSFNPTNADLWIAWEDMIKHFLPNYLCSLDIPVIFAEEFNECSLNEYNNFIPQISVPIPYIKLWNYNTMIKIDDNGFDSTNPGVWTHSLHSLQDRLKFTDWNAYRNDNIIDKQ
jgi:hypothetical protein